jgi:cyclohexanone monooxygenase
LFAALVQLVEWIIDCLVYLRENQIVSIESTPEAEVWWADQVEDALSDTLYLHAKSWYRGSNIEGKAQQFLVYTAGLGTYRSICDKIAEDHYPGFTLNREIAAPAARRASV